MGGVSRRFFGRPGRGAVAVVSAELREMLAALGDQPRWMLARLDRTRVLTEAERDEIVTWCAQHLRIVAGLAPATVGQYGRSIATLYEWLHGSGREIGALTAEDIEAWMRWLYVERRFAALWRRNHLIAARSYFGWRERTRRGGTSPARHVPGPRLPKTVRKRYSTEQLRKLFTALDGATPIARRDRALLGLAYAAGLRREELARLSLSALDLGARVLRITVDGKGSKQRVVTCEGPPVAWLRAWLVDRDAFDALEDPEAVWLSLGAPRVRGQRLSMRAIDELARRAGREAEIGVVSLHRMRVTYATDLYDQGVDIERIRSLLGHDSIETTRKYIAVSDRVQRTRLSAARLASVMGGAGIPAWAAEKLGEGSS